MQFEVFRLSNGRIKGIRHAIRLRSHSTDLAVFREIFLFKSYDITLDVYPKLIIDGGGNIGLTSIYLANKFPDCTIYTFEPDQGNFQVLCEKKCASSVLKYRSSIQA